jgi:hypothetical protein
VQKERAESSQDLRGRTAKGQAAVQAFFRDTQVEQEMLNFMLERVDPGFAKTLTLVQQRLRQDPGLASLYLHSHSLYPSVATLYNKSTPGHLDSQSSIRG